MTRIVTKNKTNIIEVHFLYFYIFKTSYDVGIGKISDQT